MKKIAMMALLACFVLSLGFAQEFTPSVSVSGSATFKLGFNLDTSVFALKNSGSADLKVNLVPKASATTDAAEGAYGWIQLKDWKLEDFGVSDPKVNAKIVFDPFFVQLYNESDLKSLSAGGHSLPNLMDGNFLLTTIKGDTFKATAADLNYLYAGYDTDNFDFTLKVGNGNDYCADAEGVDAMWAFAPEIAFAADQLSVKASALYAMNIAVDTAVGTEVAYTMPLNDQINIAPSVGFDLVLPEGADATWAAGVGVFAKWGGQDEYNSYTLASDECEYSWSKFKHQGGAGVGLQYQDDGTMNMVVQANEQRGDDGLVPGLGAGVDFEISDLTDTMGMAAGVFVNYKVNNITPYARVQWKDATAAGNADGSLALGAGLEVASVLPNTTLTIDYATPELMGTANSGLLLTAVKISF